MKKNNRNLGIDTLRIVAMFSIVTLHIMKHGGILNHAAGSQFYVIWFLQTVIICSVDCYALISGYVGYSKVQVKSICYRKALNLWLQVWFLSVGLYTAISLCGGVFSIKEFVKACLPITTNQYWYFTAYAGVFIAAPWINQLINRFTEDELKKFVYVVVYISVLYIPLVGILYDPIKVEGGYSALWLVILYIIGALIKKTDLPDRYTKRQWTAVAMVCFVLSYAAKVAVPSQNILSTYISPTTLIFSICMIALFSKFKVPYCMEKAVLLLASVTFGVYLVHDNTAVRSRFLTDKFTWVLNYPTIVTLGVIVLCAVAVFSLSALVEGVRQKVFKLLKVDTWQEKIMERVGELRQRYGIENR